MRSPQKPITQTLRRVPLSRRPLPAPELPRDGPKKINLEQLFAGLQTAPHDAVLQLGWSEASFRQRRPVIHGVYRWRGEGEEITAQPLGFDGNALEGDHAPWFAVSLLQLAHAIQDEARECRLKTYQPETGRGELRRLTLRAGFEGQTLVTVESRPGGRSSDFYRWIDRWFRKNDIIAGVVREITGDGGQLLGTEIVHGRDYLEEHICHINLRVSAGLNPYLNPRITEEQAQFVVQCGEPHPDRAALVLGDGVGQFALPLARAWPHVVAAALDERLGRELCHNARQNSLRNCRLIDWPVLESHKVLAKENLKIDFLLLAADVYPRSPALWPFLLEWRPKNAVAFANDAAAIAAFAKQAAKDHYQLVKLLAFEVVPPELTVRYGLHFTRQDY